MFASTIRGILGLGLINRPARCIQCWETKPLSLPNGSPCQSLGLSVHTLSANKHHPYISHNLVKEFPSCTSTINFPDFNMKFGWYRPDYQPSINHTTNTPRPHPSSGECFPPPVGGGGLRSTTISSCIVQGWIVTDHKKCSYNELRIDVARQSASQLCCRVGSRHIILS
jgi:hypothetical protein